MSDDADRSPTLAEVMRKFIRSSLLEAHVAVVARVESYDPELGAVNVKPLQRRPLAMPTGELSSESLPVLQRVPVCWPGAGGARLTFPIQPGDLCLVIFTDYELDGVKTNGAEVEPWSTRHHHATDAVALFGFRSFASPVKGASTTAVTLGHDTGPHVAVTPTEIQLGGTDFAVALGERVQSWMNDMKLWADTLVLPSAAGPAGPPLTPAPTPPDVTSSVVRVKE